MQVQTKLIANEGKVPFENKLNEFIKGLTEEILDIKFFVEDGCWYALVVYKS